MVSGEIDAASYYAVIPKYMSDSLLTVSVFPTQTVAGIVAKMFTKILSAVTDEYNVLANPDIHFTLFVPNNAAMDEVPEQALNTITAETRTGRAFKKQVILYHFVRFYPEKDETALTVLDLGDRVIQSEAQDAIRLFFRQLSRDGKVAQFVNGAELLESVEASNGIVHIIDRFLHEIASKSSAYNYINKQAQDKYIEMRTSKFLEILEASKHLVGTPYHELNSDENYVTVFAPTDRALASLTTERMGKLKSNKLQLVKLLRRHVISSSSGLQNAGVQAVQHASLLELARLEALRKDGGLAEIPALEGSIKPISVNKELYVTNTCGRVKVLMTAQFDRYSSRRMEEVPVFANRTVNNGVIHLVDGMLGYIYNEAYEMIREDRRVSAMANHISRAPDSWADRLRLPLGTVLRAHQRITVFVPINDAFFNVERADDMEFFSNNITYVQEVLNLHIVRGQHSLTDITKSTSLPTLLPDTTARFRWQGDDLYVTVDHIEAKVVVPDVCVENGILHFVDAVLGVPYLTIFEYIYRKHSLLNLYRNIRKSGVDLVLKDVKHPVTFFAPNHEAWELLQDSTVGRELLSDGGESENKLQQVLIAHTWRGYFYTDQMTSDSHTFPGSQLVLIRDGEDLFVERRGDFLTVRARVVQKDLRMTNGILYVIDRVLYENSEEAFRAIPVSSTPPRTPTPHNTRIVLLTNLMATLWVCLW